MEKRKKAIVKLLQIDILNKRNVKDVQIQCMKKAK